MRTSPVSSVVGGMVLAAAGAVLSVGILAVAEERGTSRRTANAPADDAPASTRRGKPRVFAPRPAASAEPAAETPAKPAAPEDARAVVGKPIAVAPEDLGSLFTGAPAWGPAGDAAGAKDV